MTKRKLLSSSLAFVLGIASLGSGSLAFAHEGEAHATSTANNGNMVKIQVMKHLCNPNVKNIEDFKALEAGKDPISSLANTVLNCPTTGLFGDEAVAGTVASPRMMYDFMVKGENGTKQYLTDAKFMQHKLSEADINKDVDGNGMIASSTALDISHYEFSNVRADNGKVEILESMPPAGFRFGTIRFTPPELIPNTDKQTFLATDDAKGLIKLDLTSDDDKTVMLHVYNFRTADNMSMNHGSTTTNMERTMIINQINSLLKQIQSLLMQLK